MKSHFRYISTHQAPPAALGGKAASLARLHALGLPIPAWFVLSPAAFAKSVTPEQRRALEAGGEVPGLDLHPEVREALALALHDLLPTPQARVAVRSSAIGEDGAAHSFAGQLRSLLFVAPEDVAEAVVQVWRSAFAPEVLAYRRAHGLDQTPPAPAVLVQQMVKAKKAGVAFSADPATGRRSVAVVAAVHGLGSALVDGVAEADTYRVGRDDTLEREIVRQVRAHRFDGLAAVQTVVLAAEEGTAPVLTDAQACAVTAMARAVANHFGEPQDVEWALDNENLWLLQARPITTLAGMADPDAPPVLWDNSNIAESYGGVTTPLTFSFARRAYEEVYRAFCHLMGVSETTLAAHAGTFRAMIGLHRGRMYYHLLNWYRMLALLPGFRMNRAFMETMMGVREKLPPELLEHTTPTRTERWRDFFHFTRSLFHLLREYRRLPRRTAAFYHRLDAALTLPELDTLRLDELAAHYRRLESDLLTRWDAPIVNDFFAMIFFGLSKKLVEKWIGEGLHNDLIGGEGGIISVEPARRMQAMAAQARPHPALVETLCTGSLAEIEQALEIHPALLKKYRAYLARFSDRCLDELKLESKTLRDEPLTLLRAIGHLASREDAPVSEAISPREGAEKVLRKKLRRHPLRRRMLGWVLAQARRRVVNRENLRFERTRVFGTARRLFLEMGRRLRAERVLPDAEDVFYLEADELLGFIEGTATTADLRSLAAVRRAEVDRYRQAPAPPDRFITFGPPALNTLVCPTPDPQSPDSDSRSGMACSPGRVRGRVRVMRDPRGVTVQPGEILVAERTDPGWILLFAACAGLVVERGSLLSHAAIVSRELRLPAVVGLEGATNWLQDGDEIELDGSTGRVRKLRPVLIEQSV